jgi:hypothetical protein
MIAPHGPVSIIEPRWDGTRVAFQIEVAGEVVDCAISRSALQDLGGFRHYTPADLLRCFTNARGRIEAVAATKFAAQAQSVYSVVSIWSDDLEDAPLTDAELERESLKRESKGRNRHGKGTEARQSRGKKAQGEQEAGTGRIDIP